MFGRRVTSFGSKGTGAGAASPPPPPHDGLPIEKMDHALDAAIRLFSRALEAAGLDCGGLALPGAPPPGVAALLADSVVYTGKEGLPEFLTLGMTPDFKAFSYQQHCRLFLMINAAGILEDPASAGFRNEIAAGQVPRPLLDAHLMKRWIRYIRPTGKALTAGGDSVIAVFKQLNDDCAALYPLVPAWLLQRVDFVACGKEWSGQLPAAIGRTLTPEVKRINGLPMSDFVEGLITDFLVQTQMQGLQRRHGST